MSSNKSRLKNSLSYLCAGILLTAGAASAQNLLSNGNLNSPASSAAPTGWSTYKYGSGYASHEVLSSSTLIDQNDGSVHPNNTGNYDGTYEMTCGATDFSSGAGFNQIVGGAPNVRYTLVVDAGAQGWYLPTGQIRLFFLDANGNGLLTNIVDTTDSLHNGSNGGQGDKYDIGVPWQEFTNSAVSPVGTTQVKVECAGMGGGSSWFDNLVLTAPVVPPVIANVYPNGTVLEQGTNQLTFSASSAQSLTNIVVVLNGVNVSSNLVITGSPTSRGVSYTNLQANKVYTVAITVTDSSGSSSFQNFTFDTYTPSFSWEAEDYDYSSGMFTNTPVLSSSATPGSYFGVTGTQGIDFNDYSADGPENFRPDPMSTSTSTDTPRQNYVNAGVSDYTIGYFDGPGFPNADNVGLSGYEQQEWVNYTRTFPAGSYNIYGRLANGNGGTASVPVYKVTSGAGTSTQTTSLLGYFTFPEVGWGNYNYIPMVDKFGNAVTVSLSGTTTLRVGAGSGANMNFFMLLPPDTNTPTITSVYPDGSTLIQGTNTFSFTVTSPSHSIAQSNVTLTLNGVTNTSLTFAGSSSSWVVTAPLALNVTNYAAVMTVKDNVGNSHSTTVFFDTFLSSTTYGIEAEDFDFSGGQYIDNPAITSVAAGNSYFDQVGTSQDEYSGDGSVPATADFHFRSLDGISTSVCSDTPTRQVVAAQLTNALAFNYNVGYWSSNGWLNYTHNYPAGNYNIYGRLAGNSGTTNSVELDTLSGSTTTYVGTFTGLGRGYNFFDWIPLMNTNNGQLASVTLGGLQTLRTTTFGNMNPNSYLLVPAVTAPPALGYSFSAGLLTLTWTNSAFHLQTQTNSLSTGLHGGWSNYPGGATSPVHVPVSNTPGTVFFRLSN